MMQAVDVLLALGMAMRLTRLVVTDEWGTWYIKGPILRTVRRVHRPALYWFDSLLSCPFCIGFWIGVGTLASLAAAGGPGEAWEPWRWLAGALTMNYIAAHIGSRLD